MRGKNDGDKLTGLNAKGGAAALEKAVGADEMKGQIGPADGGSAACGGDDGFAEVLIVVPRADEDATAFVGDGGERLINLDGHAVALEGAARDLIHAVSDLGEGITKHGEFGQVMFDDFEQRAGIIAEEAAGDEFGGVK